MIVRTIGSVKVLEAAAMGPTLGTERSATDLIGETYGNEIDLIAIPLARLDPDFLVLRNGIAGNFLQKFVNYGFRVAIVGDVSAAVASSKPLHDFVYESNKVGRILFVPDMAALSASLTKQ